jgi:hypothetical protein
MEVDIVLSETWLSANFRQIHMILQNAISDFIDENDRIINIESKIYDSGLSRFWIYVQRAA